MYALLIVDIVSQIDEITKAKNFLRDTLKPTMNDEASSRICGGTWLIDVKNNLILLRQLLDLLDDYKIPYRVSYFENKPEFT